LLHSFQECRTDPLAPPIWQHADGYERTPGRIQTTDITAADYPPAYLGDEVEPPRLPGQPMLGPATVIGSVGVVAFHTST
jgi:hypothetical protein